MSSRPNPLHLSSCHCYGYRFWGGLSLSSVLLKSAYSRSNMKPKSSKIRSKTGSEIDWGVVLLVSGASATPHVPFILRSFERERERKKERQRERERGRKRERERASGMPNDMVTAGNRATGWISLIFARFQQHLRRLRQVNGLSCMVTGYGFWGGPIALQYFVHISDKKNSCNTKMVFNHFYRHSYTYYIYIYGKGLRQQHLLTPRVHGRPWHRTTHKFGRPIKNRLATPPKR